MIKNYKSYKSPKDFYFDTDLGFPIVITLIAAAITYVLLYFVGFIISVGFNVFISWFFYSIIYYYGKSNIGITFNFLKGVFLISAFLLFVNYGVYALVVYQKTGFFNTLYFQLWLFVLVGSPFLYYAFKYVQYYFEKREMALRYFKVHLNVNHDRELLIQIDSIQLVSTSNSTISDIKLKKAPCFYSEKELKEMDTQNRNYYLQKSVFGDRINMPFDTNYLYMSWYSIIEDKYYDIELPFPFEKLIIEQEKYPTNESEITRGKKTKPLKLHIYANGGIRLFNTDTVLIDLPSSTPCDITEEEKEQKIQIHRSSHQYYSDSKAFSGLVEKIKSSGGIEERSLIEKKLIPWSMNISGLKGKNYLEIYDVSFSKYKIEINEIETEALRFLPSRIEIVYRGNYLCDWLMLYINSQKLYQSILELTDGDEEISVAFELFFQDTPQTSLQFRITCIDKSVLFKDWEIKIKDDRKQDMVDHLLDRYEEEQKHTLLKEAWDLVADKRYDLAQEKCDAIKAIDPRFGFAYFLEARLLWYKQGFEACYAKRDYFISKTQHEPAALAHIYNNYGCLLDLELRYEECVPYFENAILQNPKEGAYVCNLAEIYCKLNNPKKAIEEAEKAKKLGHQSHTLNALLESKGMRYS